VFRILRMPALLAVLMCGLTVPFAAAQTARYQVTFDTTWTAVTHPVNYPPSPHFSGLVGGTHNAAVSFWTAGDLASLGLKRMAEWGSQEDLLAEVQLAIDAGTAEFQLSDAPLWTVPGTTAFEFDLTPDFSRVTLVAMVAPSPDWFVGVRNLDLQPGGVWADTVVVDLFPWDAGTDSGPNYTSGDQPTAPPVPVFAITEGPFTPGVPLGTLTFVKRHVSDVPEAGTLTVTAFPNPFNPSTRIAWDLPRSGRMVLTLHDLGGRRVRTLVDGDRPAGSGSRVWDGRDDTGRTLPSGAYVFQLLTAGQRRSGGLTLLK